MTTPETVGDWLGQALRLAGEEFVPGDQTRPCAVLWPDPQRLWEPVIAQTQQTVPELFVLGTYDVAARKGPALWLRCIEAQVVDGSPSEGMPPIFYLPGVSLDQLRAAEDCPPELAPLVELQYRGAMWLHVNGKEWTPHAFLVSKHGGVELDVARDQATIEALVGALPTLLDEPIAQLQNRRLDADFFHALVSPDASGLLLRWLSDTEGFQQSRSAAEWNAFCEQCKSDFSFDPVKDGPLKAGTLLASHSNAWSKVWQRFTETPGNYPGVAEWLKRAAPKKPTMFDSAEVWPNLNDSEEQKLLYDLRLLKDRPPDEVKDRIDDLEKQHGRRRTYAWQKLGRSPMASALEHLAGMVTLCGTTYGAPTPEAYAEFYARDGWQVDSFALAAMAASGSSEEQEAVLGSMRAVYLPWLEETARHLQQLITETGRSVKRRGLPIEPAAGRLVMFVDGLRMDVARQLCDRLSTLGLDSSVDWEWSTIPSVTPSGKPAASPIAGLFHGGEGGDEFATRLTSTQQSLTHERFIKTLEEEGWQFLASAETGDPQGSAWVEAGAIDKRGHSEGWKLARIIESEVRDIASRISTLVRAGWSEVTVVTDHGFLLLPYGLPKVELKSHLAEHRWGRCAALKTGAETDIPTFEWHWNSEVMIATPAGVGCFRAGIEYSHGGVSLQEMVTPVLRIRGTKSASSTRLLEAKWTGAKCRVVVGGDCTGVRVDVRTTQSDPDTSLLSDKHSRETTSDGKVTLFLEDDADIGKEATIVLIDASGQVVDSLKTTLGT